ncbi:MAG: CPBP family intramembrane metalloprotease [Aquificae bacterium]|nr:CPBP family intramembrane metalloprotease [Aquificota bacterium]
MHLALYFALVVLLFLSGFYPLEFLIPFFMLSPLFFQREEELGLRNVKRGLLFGLPFLPLGVPYLLRAECWGFVLNQVGISFSEELFFRGYLMQRFSNLQVSLMFALAHFVYWKSPNAILTFFPSLVLGFLYRRADSLLAPAIAHFSFNLLYFYLMGEFPELFRLLNRSIF